MQYYYTSYQPEHDLEAKVPSRKERSKRKHKETTKKWRVGLKRFFILLSIVLLIGVGSASWVGYKFFQNTTKVFGGSAASNFISVLRPVALNGESQGRVNILLVGNSADDPNHPGADLTDSIMVLSINPTSHSAFLLSIPRDLWVDIPGYGHAKINAAYHYGQTNQFNSPGYFLGGIGLLQEVIQQTLNIPIGYYFLINYSAVRDSVNAVGGLDINIQSSDPRGLYDPNISSADGGPLLLPNGPQHLNGQAALNLARARGDPAPDGRVSYGFPQSDFDRTQHQRQIFVALESKVFSSSIVLNPWKLGKLLDAVGNNVGSNMKIDEARRFTQIMHSINITDIKLLSFRTNNTDFVQSYNTPEGESALIPAIGYDNYYQIQNYLQQFGF